VLHVACWKYRTQKIRQKLGIWAPSHNLRTVDSQLRHVSTIGKKLVKQQYLLHMSSQYGGLWPTNGTLAISTVFASWLRYCSDVTQRRPTKLCTMFGHLLGCYTKYTFCRLLPPNGILPGENARYVLVLRSPALAALLYSTLAAGVSQTAALSRRRHL